VSSLALVPPFKQVARARIAFRLGLSFVFLLAFVSCFLSRKKLLAAARIDFELP
jgi:hypothetical protein